jgi:heme exporter protein A
MDARQTPGDPLLALRDIACLRGGRLLFEGIGLTLRPGEATIVSGANGVGKSSLLRIACGLLRPAAGQVERPAAAAWLGEQTALDGDLPLGAALAFWARLDDADPVALDTAMRTMGVER